MNFLTGMERFGRDGGRVVTVIGGLKMFSSCFPKLYSIMLAFCVAS